ncbi:MAG: alpha/beta fold hydrolase [Arachnia sp.]
MARSKRAQRIAGNAVLAALRGYFWVGERVAPGLASRLALDLWLRVPPPPPASRRDRGLPPGVGIETTVRGQRLVARAWGSGPSVLLVHGWAGWWQQLSVYVEPLVAAGFRVVAWDAPGHGESPPGRFGNGRAGIPDFVDGIDAVAAALGAGPIAGIVAHSGGAMAGAMALMDGLDADCAVFIAPAVDTADMIDYAGRRLGFGPRTGAALVRRAREAYGVHLARDFNVPAAVPRAGGGLPPALIVHDEADTDAPHHGADRLAAVWPQATLVTTTGLGHHKVLWSRETVARVVSFLSGSS